MLAWMHLLVVLIGCCCEDSSRPSDSAAVGCAAAKATALIEAHFGKMQQLLEARKMELLAEVPTHIHTPHISHNTRIQIA